MEPLFNLDGCRFSACGHDHGPGGVRAVFEYRQHGDQVSGEYRGGEIVHGLVVGHFTDADRLEMLFESLTAGGHLRAGRAIGTVSRDFSGKLRLALEWTWLYGADGCGISGYVEV